jgi:hypothetical protein
VHGDPRLERSTSWPYSFAGNCCRVTAAGAQLPNSTHVQSGGNASPSERSRGLKPALAMDQLELASLKDSYANRMEQPAAPQALDQLLELSI